MVKVACYGEMHSTVDNFFAKFLFIFELVCEILFLILILTRLSPYYYQENKEKSNILT